jgi:nucleotide-binding universal stress UspA family protein
VTKARLTTATLSAVEKSRLKNAATVVVGVDGSAGAAEALSWAVAEARLRKARLLIVHAWTYGYADLPLGGFGAMGAFASYVPFDDIDPVDLQKAADGLVEAAMVKVPGGVVGVEVERRVVEGGAAQVLIGAALGADLLVVGSRGHGGFAGLMLGSVSQQCVHHAPCPVVVVRSHEAIASDHELARASASVSAATV